MVKLHLQDIGPALPRARRSLGRAPERAGIAADRRAQACRRGGALYDLSGKFGVTPGEAAELLRRARTHAARLGISFHIGSQCLDPQAYSRALELAAEAVAGSEVAVDVIDVGGGFPVSHPDLVPPPLADFVAAIAEGAALLPQPVRP